DGEIATDLNPVSGNRTESNARNVMAHMSGQPPRRVGVVGHGSAESRLDLRGTGEWVRSAGELEGAVRCEAGGETAQIEPIGSGGVVGEHLAHRLADV